MAEVHTWSGTAAYNDSSPPDGAPEGMAPSAVNDVIREVMAAIKRKDDDENGALVTGGSATAYTVATPNRTIAAYENGLRLRVRLHTATGAAPTLNVNSLGAVRLAWPYSADGRVSANQIPGAAILDVVYRESFGPDGAAWVIVNGGGDAYGARRKVFTVVGSGAISLNQTLLINTAALALTLPSSADYAAGDEVELLALASPAGFTIAPDGSDTISWSDFATATTSGTPRGFGGATSTFPRACRIRKIGTGQWYGFVYGQLPA